jgi:hypothetical protein
MIQTLTKNWWLLALCAVLDAIVAAIFLVMQQTDGPLTFHARKSAVALLGEVTMAAGVCAVVAGLWRSTTGKCWLLILNGLALFALGLIYYRFVRFGVSFLTIALLIIVMAMSIGVLEFLIARSLQYRWLLELAGVASVGFALVFLALGFRWIGIEPGSHTDLVWLGAYFGFSAICMLGLALWLHGPLTLHTHPARTYS